MPIEPKAKTASASAVIVIPTYNEAAFIAGLLDSMEQYAPAGAQVIVVDNGSTDRTPEIAAERGAKVIRLPSKVFPAVARNIGIENSDHRRDILVFLDADVELTPEWQTEWHAQMQALRANPMQLTGAAYEISKNPSWIERVWFAPMRLRQRSYIPGGNIITTRALFTPLGGFDTRLQTGEDVDLCVRARHFGASVNLNNGFKVHHEGFPKGISEFLKRERWHGTGDLTSLRRAARSRIVWATSLFVMLHVAGIIAAIHAAASGGTYVTAGICALGIASLCTVGATKAVGHGHRPPSVGAMAVMYLYYVGRALSMWDSVRNAMSPRRRHTEHSTHAK